MLFRHNRVEYSDGVIDLIPLHIAPPSRELGFGHEQVWRITLHNERQEIGQISYRDGESRCVYYYGHIGYHIDRRGVDRAGNLDTIRDVAVVEVRVLGIGPGYAIPVIFPVKRTSRRPLRAVLRAFPDERADGNGRHLPATEQFRRRERLVGDAPAGHVAAQRLRIGARAGPGHVELRTLERIVAICRHRIAPAANASVEVEPPFGLAAAVVRRESQRIVVPDVQQLLGAETIAERHHAAIGAAEAVRHLHGQVAISVGAIEVPAPASQLPKRVVDEHLVLGIVCRERGELDVPLDREALVQLRRLEDGRIRHGREHRLILVADLRRVVPGTDHHLAPAADAGRGEVRIWIRRRRPADVVVGPGDTAIVRITDLQRVALVRRVRDNRLGRIVVK